MTAITMLIENFRKLQEEQFLPDRDVIFSICHEDNGGDNLYSLINRRYRDIITINLGEFGQISNNNLYAYISDDLKSDIIKNYMHNILDGSNYQLQTVDKNSCTDYSIVDNKHYITIYNYDNNSSSNKLENIDTNNIKDLSDIVYDIIRETSYNIGDITGCMEKRREEVYNTVLTDLKDKCKVGQYIFVREPGSFDTIKFIGTTYDLNFEDIKNDLGIVGEVESAKVFFDYISNVTHTNEEYNTICGEILGNDLPSIKEKCRTAAVSISFIENDVSVSYHFSQQKIIPSTRAHNYKNENVDGYTLYISYDEPLKNYEVEKMIDGQRYSLRIKVSNRTEELSKEKIDSIFESVSSFV